MNSMKKYFRLYSITKTGERGSEQISYAIPFLSKEQFCDIVNELIHNGFRLLTLSPNPKVKLSTQSALRWLNSHLTDLPPYSANLYLRHSRNRVKLYSSGNLVSSFPIEQYITDFLKNVFRYKRISRSYDNVKPAGKRFENSYFILNWSNGLLKIFIKSRFESPRSLWFTNRRVSKYYILEDEMIILRDLCIILKPEKIECLFNFPIERDSVPITKPGCRPMFKAETTSYVFLDIIGNLLSNYTFPIDLKKSKSFIVSEDSSVVFKKPNLELDYVGLWSIFNDLKNYCFDSFHVFKSFHEINV